MTSDVVDVLLECRLVSHQTCSDGGSRGHVTSSSLYVSFSVGAVAVTLLSVIVSALTETYLPTRTDSLSLKHRRALIGTVLLNDTVLNDIFDNDTVLDNTATQSDTVLTNLTDRQSTNVTDNPPVNLTTGTSSRPRKPEYLDASRLNQHPGAADGSKFRAKIRQNLGDVPAENVDGVSTTLASLTQTVTAANTTDDILTLSQRQNDSDTPMSASNTSSVTLQDIMKEIESVMTSDQMSDHLTNDGIEYSTANTTDTAAAAAAADDDDDDDADSVSTDTSSANDLPSPMSALQPTSPALPASSSSSSAAAAASVQLSDTQSVSSSMNLSISNVSSSVTAAHRSSLRTLPHHSTTTRPHVIHSSSLTSLPHHNTTANPLVTRPSSFHSVPSLKPTPNNLSLSNVSALTTDSTTVSLSANLSLRAVTLSAGTPTSTAVSAAAASGPDKASYSGCDIILLTVAVITLLVSLMFAAMSSCCQSPTSPLTKSHQLSPTSSHTRHPTVIHIVTGLLHFFQSAVEWSYCGLVVEFAASVLAWSSTASIVLVFVYWLGYSVGHGACYFLITRVRPWHLMFSGALLSCVSSLVMLVGSLQFTASAEIAARNSLMWFSSAVLGLSTSMVLPTSHKYIPSTTSLSLAVVVGAGVGQASVPGISALLADTYSPSFIIKVIFVAAVGVVAISILLKYVVTRSSNSTSTVSSRHFHVLDSSSVEMMDNMMVSDDIDEQAKLLSQAASVDIETSLVINTPSSSSSSSASSLQSFIRNISNYSKND